MRNGHEHTGEENQDHCRRAANEVGGRVAHGTSRLRWWPVRTMHGANINGARNEPTEGRRTQTVVLVSMFSTPAKRRPPEENLHAPAQLVFKVSVGPI